MNEETWEKEFDERFPKALLPLIDRELHEKGVAAQFVGRDSEYFGAIKTFIRSVIYNAVQAERKIWVDAEKLHDKKLAEKVRGMKKPFNRTGTHANGEDDLCLECNFNQALDLAAQVIEGREGG